MKAVSRPISNSAAATAQRLLLRPAAGALLLALCAAAPADQLYKCKDAAGRITYTSTECARLGLQSAGEIREQLNVTPALKFKLPPPAPQQKPAAAPAQPAAQAAEEKAPERRCFTVKTAKGTATRCNDKPSAEDEPQKQQ
jgi:Domain of unknown function (DUF4124)